MRRYRIVWLAADSEVLREDITVRCTLQNAIQAALLTKFPECAEQVNIEIYYEE